MVSVQTIASADAPAGFARRAIGSSHAGVIASATRAGGPRITLVPVGRRRVVAAAAEKGECAQETNAPSYPSEVHFSSPYPSARVS